MFIVEVDFNDGESKRELILLKRTYARIGATETSHVILDGVSLPCDILVEKCLGNSFRCSAWKEKNSLNSDYEWTGLHTRSVDIAIGSVFISIMTIDPHMMDLFNNEKIETLSNRDYLKNIRTDEIPVFPALQCLSDPKVGLSLSGLSHAYIGRSRECAIRLDHPSITAKHAHLKRVASSFIIESLKGDLPVTVNGRSLGAGSRTLNPGDRIEFLPSLKFVYLESQKDVDDIVEELACDKIYPQRSLYSKALRVLAGDVSPAFLTLKEGQTLSVGRDPAHSVWINAAFISRLHATITVYTDSYGITDFSSNGTLVNGKKLTQKEETFFDAHEPIAISFGPQTEIVLSDFDNKKFEEWQKKKLSIEQTIATVDQKGVDDLSAGTADATLFDAGLVKDKMSVSVSVESETGTGHIQGRDEGFEKNSLNDILDRFKEKKAALSSASSVSADASVVEYANTTKDDSVNYTINSTRESTGELQMNNVVFGHFQEKNFSEKAPTDNTRFARSETNASPLINSSAEPESLFSENTGKSRGFESSREKSRNIDLHSHTFGIEESERDEPASFVNSFEEFQKGQKKKLRDMDAFNYIDPSLEESMERYSYENPAANSSSKFILYISGFILILLLGFVFLMSQFML